jgi:hypothetical protein
MEEPVVVREATEIGLAERLITEGRTPLPRL